MGGFYFLVCINKKRPKDFDANGMVCFLTHLRWVYIYTKTGRSYRFYYQVVPTGLDASILLITSYKE